MFFLLQINTFTLEPSFIGFTTIGNFNLFLITLISCEFFLLKEYVKNFGVFILYFINTNLYNVLYKYFIHMKIIIFIKFNITI